MIAPHMQVHIFPEGTRSRDPKRMLPVRKGVGRLVVAAASAGQQPPLVVPFVHAGMEDVMPVGHSLPASGQQVWGWKGVCLGRGVGGSPCVLPPLPPCFL